MSRKIKKNGRKGRTLIEISVVIVILFFASVFAISHKLNRVVISNAPKIKVMIDGGIILPPDVVEKPTEPSKPKIPLPTYDDDLDDIVDSKELIFEDPDNVLEVSVMPPPPPPPDIDIFTYISVQVKPEMTSKARTKLARYIYNNYPSLAKRSGVSGMVILSFICSKNGMPTNIRILKENPQNMGFGEIAIKAIRQVRFIPGLQRNRPVSVRMKLPIKFSTR